MSIQSENDVIQMNEETRVNVSIYEGHCCSYHSAQLLFPKLETVTRIAS